MTLKEFFKLVPLENNLMPLVIGNGFFDGFNLSSGRFVALDRSRALNLSEDYELLNVSVRNDKLFLEIDCNG